MVTFITAAKTIKAPTVTNINNNLVVVVVYGIPTTITYS